MVSKMVEAVRPLQVIDITLPEIKTTTKDDGSDHHRTAIRNRAEVMNDPIVRM